MPPDLMRYVLSMRTDPVKYSSDPLAEGCEPFLLTSIFRPQSKTRPGSIRPSSTSGQQFFDVGAHGGRAARDGDVVEERRLRRRHRLILRDAEDDNLLGTQPPRDYHAAQADRAVADDGHALAGAVRSECGS